MNSEICPDSWDFTLYVFHPLSRFCLFLQAGIDFIIASVLFLSSLKGFFIYFYFFLLVGKLAASFVHFTGFVSCYSLVQLFIFYFVALLSVLKSRLDVFLALAQIITSSNTVLQRFRLPRINSSRWKNSFVPTAIL